MRQDISGDNEARRREEVFKWIATRNYRIFLYTQRALSLSMTLSLSRSLTTTLTAHHIHLINSSSQIYYSQSIRENINNLVSTSICNVIANGLLGSITIHEIYNGWSNTIGYWLSIGCMFAPPHSVNHDCVYNV